MNIDFDLIKKHTQQHKIYETKFLQNFENGAYNKEQIIMFLKEQFWISRQFPQCLAILYGRIEGPEDVEIAFPLMHFLAVEHHGSTEARAHWKLLYKTLLAFNISPGALKKEKPSPATQRFLKRRRNFCLNKSVEEVLGGFTFAHELANEKIFQSWLSGIRKINDVPIKAYDYFETQVEDEPQDYIILKDICVRVVEQHKGRWSKILEGADTMLRMRLKYFEELEQLLAGNG